MKRLPLIITTFLIVLLAGGYYLYTNFFSKSYISGWDVVPSEAVFVYEGSACESCLDELSSSSIVSLVKKAVFPTQEDSLKKLTDVVLTNFRQGSLVSMHVTRKDEFDFVFYLPFTAQLQQQFNGLVEQLQKEKGGKAAKISDRTYNGIKIYDLTVKGKTFSWIYLDKMWVGSFTPILIEDVVRTYNDEAKDFKSEIEEVYNLPTIKKDGGNIYLNLRKVSQWLGLFSSDIQSLLVHQLGKSALLDVKVSDKSNFVLNGFCLDSARNPNYILSSFSSQNPVSFNLKQFVSNRALMFASFGISDGKSFSRDLKSFNQNNQTLRDTLQKISDTYKVNTSSLVSTLSGELGVCWMESKGKDLSKILIVNSATSADEWMNTFNTLSEKLSIDTVFYERFSEYDIRELPLYRFPEKILWPFVTGFNTSYYTRAGKTIIIGDNLEELKRFLEDIDKEETWGKSVAQNQFIESTLLESNISLYVNTPRVWSALEKSLHPKWRTFIQDNRSLIRSIGMGAIQFSHLNDSYYTNVSWSYKPGRIRSPSEPPPTTDKIITNVNESLAKIFIVRSHVSKNEEILVQDSARNIRLISPDGKVLWKLALDGLIVGEVEEVDYFSNGKLQYFFATPGALHIVDRLGNYVKPFPVAINEKDIDFVSIVDYDHSKKYRFLVAGKSGKLWMYDKQGVNLEGWTPKDVTESLSAPPRHYRIRGKDYVVAIRKDGNAFVMNRRGETLKGFPINLNARPAGDYFLERGNSLHNTYFVVVSRDGFLIRFNLDGKVQSRETLLKNTVDAKFSLVGERDLKSFLILRQEARQLALFDENLKQIVTSDFVGNNPVEITYLDFGAGKIYIAISDTSQDLSYVYDEEGKLLTSVPVESHAIAVRPLDIDKIRIFSILDKSLTIQAY